MTQETKILAGIGAVAVVLVIGAAFIFGDSSKKAEPTNPEVSQEKLVRSDSNQIATDSAKVTVVEFADFQCPACAATHPTVKEVLTAYAGKINYVFRHFPLQMHQNAEVAALAAEAAGEQDKFWEMHDKLFENQKDWETSTTPLDIFATYAEELELDVEKLKTFVQERKAQDKINQDRNDGIELGVNGTPTFFVNGEKWELQTLPSLSDFKAKLDPLVK